MQTKAQARSPRNYKAPSSGYHRPLDTSSASYSIYHGQDRAGSFRRVLDRWVAVDRLGKELGSFSTERDAIAAIDRVTP